MPRSPQHCNSAEALPHLFLINAGGNIHEYTCQKAYFLSPSSSVLPHQMWKSGDPRWRVWPCQGQIRQLDKPQLIAYSTGVITPALMNS